MARNNAPLLAGATGGPPAGSAENTPKFLMGEPPPLDYDKVRKVVHVADDADAPGDGEGGAC